MQRPLLGLLPVAASLVVALVAPLARAADRSDPIPVTVGPPGGVGFYVNPTAAGLDSARVQEILRRSLARWGNTYLGTTTAEPGDADDVNVIGVTALPDGVLGLTQLRTVARTARVAAHTVCAREPGKQSDTVRRTSRPQTVLLRRDVVVAGAVRPRSVSRRLRIPRFTRVRAPRSIRVCTAIGATTATTVTPHVDVLIKPSPQFGPWTLGPDLPVSPAYDFETDVLHELGHVSGLAHQVDECDPSTPMPSDQSPTEFWHGVEEWRRPGCSYPVPPAPAAAVLSGSDSSEPLPGVGSRLAGYRILINPRVPAGYDSARFVAVAERAIRRAGATPAGLTNTAPVSGDGQTVLGFFGLREGVLSSWGSTSRSQSVPAYTVRTCRTALVPVRRPVVLRRTVPVGGARVRRDVVQTRTRRIAGYACKSARRAARHGTVAPELDVRVSETSVAWELGPRLPTDGTRWDLESSLVQTLASASGAPTGAACDTTTPNSSTGLSPGDWWRSSTEVRRSRCVAGTENRAAPVVAVRRAAAGAPAEVTAGNGRELRAAGLPYDVQALP